MRMWFSKHHIARVPALALCLGVVLGGSLPELGNLAVYYWLPKGSDAHQFNTYFLAAGLLGLVICGLSLVRRYRMDHTLDKPLKKNKED